MTRDRKSDAWKGPDRFHIYVAVDDARTAVALLPPLVDGDAEHRATGAIISVDPKSMRRRPYPTRACGRKGRRGKGLGGESHC